jgi:hypothetical protein
MELLHRYYCRFESLNVLHELLDFYYYFMVEVLCYLYLIIKQLAQKPQKFILDVEVALQVELPEQSYNVLATNFNVKIDHWLQLVNSLNQNKKLNKVELLFVTNLLIKPLKD